MFGKGPHPRDGTTPRVNPKVTYGLQVIIVYPWTFRDCKECPILGQSSRGGHACGGQAAYGDPLPFLLQFCYGLKAALKNLKSTLKR